MKRSFLFLLTLAFATPLGAQAPQHLRSWTTDDRPRAIGEILTVVISEQTMASDVGTSRSEAQRSSGVSGSADLGNLVELPVSSLSLGGRAERQESGSDQIRRTDLFTGEIAVRVIGMTEDGQLEISGERQVKIDNRKRRLRFNGIVRPQDISANGYVLSHRVADAEISYSGGPSRLRGGFIGRFIGWIWPF